MNKLIVPAISLLALFASACSGVESASSQASEAGATQEEITTTTLDDGELISASPEAVTAAPDSVAFSEPDVAVDEAATGAPEATVVPSTTTVVAPTTTTEVVVEDDASTSTPCEAPAFNPHFADVALDDSDGGLNYREAPGGSSPIITTFTRGVEVIPTGNCSTIGSTDWWEVHNTDGSLTGWVSSNFLSDQSFAPEAEQQNPEFAPGLGAEQVDTINVGVGGPTLEIIMGELAIAYGFGPDVEITQVGEIVGIDATSATAVFELGGLQSDTSNGYRFNLQLSIERFEVEGGDADISYTITGLTSQSLCTRGVSPDGLCI